MCNRFKFLFGLMLLSFSCNEIQHTNGFILERRRVDDSTTIIIYTYELHNTSKIDSQKIVNTLFPNDSIKVTVENNKSIITP